jgi:hypothetical protein
LAKEAIKDFESRGALTKSVGDGGQEQSLNGSFGGISNFCTAPPSRFIGSDQISALLRRFPPGAVELPDEPVRIVPLPGVIAEGAPPLRLACGLVFEFLTA